MGPRFRGDDGDGLLRRITPRNDETRLRILAARGARGVRQAVALKKFEGVGNAGCRCTRSLVCEENKHTS
jgi:hypothetical protein